METNYYNVDKYTKYKAIAIVVILLISLAFIMSGCMPYSDNYTQASPAGFFDGILHGWVAPFTLIHSFFGDGGIYAVNNTGFPYDLGFYLSILGGFGGFSLSRGRKYDSQNVVYKYENEV